MKEFLKEVKYAIKHVRSENFEIVNKGLNHDALSKAKYLSLLLGTLIVLMYKIYTSGYFDLSYIITLITSMGFVWIALGKNDLFNEYVNDSREQYRVPIRYFVFSIMSAVVFCLIKVIIIICRLIISLLNSNEYFFMTLYNSFLYCTINFINNWLWASTIVYFSIGSSFLIINFVIKISNKI
ncbi:hypothetical protein [Leuconostoc citreum]|uniref:hypothetical protein n=1 Tax=Leuconostoc citreum TaxID=33964 RepID=UPI0021A48B0B|nr:hypothetical protein [Leuconostoc citreum]MCT3057280.1 hypothetical protein [Leuconostoc citreum]MCT3061300.1 hypothetical protein [Leuconostoc citreum]